MTPSPRIERLVEIMRQLRDPEDGCPWDIEQTPRSIIPYTVEETYEVVEAIEKGDPLELRDELGDLLLQVVYHSQFAAERGDFTFDDVVLAITRKMIRRHPHVFGNAEARSAASAKGMWDAIKAEEKRERAAERKAKGLRDPATNDGLLSSVSSAFPPTMEAQKLQEKMAKVGFDWPDAHDVLGKVDEELNEVREAVESDDHDAVEDEIGDLLFTIINLARLANVDADAALRRTNRKVRKRFRFIETTLEAEGSSAEMASLDEMEHAWMLAKHDQRSGS